MDRQHTVSKKLLSTHLLLILLCSTFLTVLTASSSMAQMGNADLDTAGTHVSWEKEHESRVDTWSWASLAWEFGPYPRYRIVLKNDTEVTDANFIPLGEDFSIIIDVKKGIFTGNTTLGGAGLNWNTNILNVSNPQESLGWANARMGYVNYVTGEAARWTPGNTTWTIWSEIFNRTEQALKYPEVKFGVSQDGMTIRRLVNLTATNLWNASSPSQSLPPAGATTYMPGVKAGDWANYTMLFFVQGSTTGGGMPSNGTARIEIRNVIGSRVELGITMTDANGTRTTGHWIDVASGEISDKMAEGTLIASNLTASDKIYNTTSAGAPTINQTVEQTIGGAQRLVNHHFQSGLAWDRSTGIIISENTTEVIGATGPGPGPGPGSGPMGPSNAFYIWNSSASVVSETDTSWVVTIVGKFNSTNTPKGPYNVNLEIYDSEGNRIDFGYAAWAGKASPWRMVAVGRPGLVYAGMNEYWTFAKLDMKNQSVYSVARGQHWVMQVNVTSQDVNNLANVTVAFNVDNNIKTYVNVTNWHPETVVETGGWMYNSTSKTYYWNASAQIMRTEQVYGPHMEERWLWLPHQHEVNVTRRFWNATTQKDELKTFTEYIWDERIFLIYDHTTGNFSVKQGYSYWSFDEDLGYEREFKVLTPLNASDLATTFYNLNLSRCRTYEAAPNTLTVEFVGSFNETTYSTRDQYWINQPTVFRRDGRQIWADWESVDWGEFEIAVDRMVAITKIFDEQGREVKNWMFQTDSNQSFIIQSILQGAKKLYDDIDSAGVRFHAGEGRWMPTESYWSDVQINLVYNKYEDTLNSETYNRTEKSAYVYGPHMAWKEVNVTGYHDEYNVTTGTWEWVNSTYKKWDYVNVTEYYWAYYSLNQTELALNASSPDIWIDRSEKWIPWEDPAFRVRDTYATLNSANISLVEGLVTANLNITFNSNAPQTRYWWEITFGNRTFGPDWSQGWGEHTVTEWTKETVRYVNSTATNNEKWYVETPSQPFYTIYNGTRYRVYETPYIVLDGTTYYVNTRTTYDYWSGTERTDILLRDQWDPVLQREPRYYQLLNGTKIYVQQGYKVLIRDIKLNCTGAYRLEGDVRLYLPNQTIFNTFMDHAEMDWGRAYWNETTWEWVQPRFYELINGTRVFRDTPFEDSEWNSTTNRYDLTNEKYTENATSLMVDYAGRCVFLNWTILVELRDDGSWWQYSPSAGGYYLVMKNGTKIAHPNPWNYDDQHRIVTIKGKNYTIGWPTEYYTGTYRGETLIIKGGGGGFVRNYYYTSMGGDKYEMPYPEAQASSWWDLENLKSNGGKVPTGKSIIINNVKYPIQKAGTIFYIVVGGVSQPVTKPEKDTSSYYSTVGSNRMEFWNITQRGWSLQYGTWKEKTDQMDPVAGTLRTSTGYDPESKQWREWNKYGEDRENCTRYLINMTDGSRIDVYEGRYLSVWEVVIGGRTYYTLDEWDRSAMVMDNATGQMVWRQYITTLNGTKVYFDWGSNPANWVYEYHVELPGANYTRLVPYELENRTYFDKTYVYNITITDNHGMSWQNGTSVANGTNVKVWGTEYGPGIRVGRDRWSGYIWWKNLNEEGGRAYLETVEGIKVYCNRSWLPDGREYPFGWNFNTQQWRSQEGYSADMQWMYINNNQTQGRKAATTIEGGRYIRLISNETRRLSFLEITLAGWQGWWPNYYVILKNGTLLEFAWEGWTWLSDVQMGMDRSVVIGGQLYWSESWQGTYYNVTDSGVIRKLYDDSYLAPSTYLVPVPKFNDPTKPTIWMNTTSDHILINSSKTPSDIGYYYLINSSSGDVVQLDSVNKWWSSLGLSEKVRSDLFNSWDTPWEIRDRRAQPRYNITLNVEGNLTGYFVLDPSPTAGNWWPGGGDHSRYPATFTFNGTAYPINYNDWVYRWRNYNAIVVSGSKYELQDQYGWKAVYSAPPLGEITITQENIYKEHTTWGPAYKWMLADLNVITVKRVYDIVVGTPKMGMWGVKAYEIVPETGAVDLDGDLSTTSDQYYVRRTNTGADTWNRTEDRMWVELVWDPNATIIGDEMHIGGWMGKVRTSWSFTWNETYVWYYASNMSTVSQDTLTQINATLINSETGEPKPGYWEISRMAQNTTWEDLKAKAEREGWDWFTDNTHEWEWMWFGVRQDYKTQWMENAVSSTADIGIGYEYAGLLLYNDTNADKVMQNAETTHFFMPSRVNSITFRSPGEDFGNYNETGSITAALNKTINFGVTFLNINGTLFPYDPSKPRDMWGWWGGVVYGADFSTPNLNNKPTNSGVDSLQFMIHFNASVATAENATNNEAEMKIDERVGQWTIDPKAIDGRKKALAGNFTTYLKGLEVLQNRSLALSWYVTAFTNVAWSVKDQHGSAVSPNNVTSSETFDIAPPTATAKFASVRMGGTYDWKKPIAVNDTLRTFNVSSYTTPIGTFRASYISDAGKSSAGFDITSSMYFLTVGMNNWDGYPVYHDPSLSAYVAKYVATPEAPEVTKTPTSISCSLSNTAITKGESVTINGAINASVAAPVTIQTSTDAGATWSDLTTVTSSSTGAYSCSWSPTSVGTYNVRATWSGDATHLGATSEAAALIVTEVVDHSVTYGGVSYTITTLSNSKVSDFTFDTTKKELSFTVEGVEGTMGFANVTIPKSLVTAVGDIKVYVDDILVSHTVTENENNYYVYFTYQHSIHTVKIMLAPTPTVTPKPTTISCDLSKTSITKGESVTISGTINASVSASVTIQVSTDGGSTWDTLATVMSSTDGRYSYAWTPVASGTYAVRAIWSGNEQYLGATSPTKTLTVAQPVDYTNYIVVAVVVLVMAVAGIAFVLRKRSAP